MKCRLTGQSSFKRSTRRYISRRCPLVSFERQTKIKNARWRPHAGCCWSPCSRNHARTWNQELMRLLQKELLAVRSNIPQDRRKIWSSWRRCWDRPRTLQHRKTTRLLRPDRDPVNAAAVSVAVVQGFYTIHGNKRPAWTSRTILMNSASPPIS